MALMRFSDVPEGAVFSDPLSDFVVNESLHKKVSSGESIPCLAKINGWPCFCEKDKDSFGPDEFVAYPAERFA